MADQKRWFKVWTSLLTDMDNVPDHLIGKWTRLGCRTALVGNAGTVMFDDWEHLARFLNVDAVDAKSTLQGLPSVSFEEGENRHGKVTVTFRKWRLYQEDSTQAARQRASRSKRRGEEKRQDEKRLPPKPPAVGVSVSEPEQQPPESSDQPAYTLGPCAICLALLGLLNEQSCRNYSGGGRGMLWLHDRHLQHGAERVKAVIVAKVAEWGGTVRHQFLRPETLFEAGKFDGYVNALPSSGPAESPEAEAVFRRIREGRADG